MSMREESPAYMVVTLTRKQSGASSQHYVIPVVNGSALLGHEPCSGAFGFEDGKSYRARVEVFDSAGNLGARRCPRWISRRPRRPRRDR